MLSPDSSKDPNTGLKDSQNLVAPSGRVLGRSSQVPHAAQWMLMRNGLEENLGEAGVGDEK